MFKKALFIFIILGLVSTAYADEGGIPEKGSDPLSYSERSAWTTYNEIYLFGGPYHGDSFENSWQAGIEYAVHFTKHFGFGIDFIYSKADYTENRFYNTAGFFNNDNVYIIDGVFLANLPASLRIKKHTIESDLYLMLGAGTININSSFEPLGVLGGGMKIYALPWLALRFEIRNMFHTTNKPGGANEKDFDLLFNGGISFKIPPKIKPKKK